jgi:hypothetical protein
MFMIHIHDGIAYFKLLQLLENANIYLVSLKSLKLNCLEFFIDREDF